MSSRYGSRALSFVAAIALSGLTLGGCVANDLSLTITRFIPPDPSAAMMGMCKLDPEITTNLTRGIYDANLGSATSAGYFVNFVVKSNLQAATIAPIETQAYYINSFDVELELQGAVKTVIPESKRRFNYASGSVRLTPGSSASASAIAIKPEFADAIATLNTDDPGLVIAHVRPVATRAEEQVVGAFVSFPIQICRGCLTGSTTYPDCPLPKGTIVPPGNACNPAQDLAVGCCGRVDANMNTTLACGSAAPISSM